jgi:GNAT superfamily N-acetyltransferase
VLISSCRNSRKGSKCKATGFDAFGARATPGIVRPRVRFITEACDDGGDERPMMMVATSDRRPVGFAGVRQVAGTTVVSDCFVDPDHQGQGVGTELLSRLVPHDRPVMTFASSDPKARALYRRFDMAARWDCHYLEGDPGGVERVVGPVWEASGYPVEESDLPHSVTICVARSSERVEAMPPSPDSGAAFGDPPAMEELWRPRAW